MRQETEKFLKLFFEPEESICVSHNEYGYHSIAQEDLSGDIKLQSPVGFEETITEKDINLIAINPIQGFRRDVNVTSFRSFLIEVDDLSLPDQKKYIEDSGIPYSICVFSGNRSLHYGIVLDETIPNLELWKYVNKWITNILSKADQQNQNPSRSIRFPGNHRNNGKKMLQKLIEIKGRVSQQDLNIWLNKHEEYKPFIKAKEEKFDPNNMPDFNNMPVFFYDTLERLKNGTQEQRNASWFQVACIMADRNFSLEEMFAYLEQFYIEENDFKRREWETCLKSAYKRSGV